MKITFGLLLSVLCSLSFASKDSLNFAIMAPDMRDHVSLAGTWKAIVDPLSMGDSATTDALAVDGYFKDRQPKNSLELVEYSFDTGMDIEVPGDWHTQIEKLFFYEGIVWYRTKFDISEQATGKHLLHFGAVNYHAKVFVNGQFVGEHKGGYTPFSFDVSDQISTGKNSLVVKVTNLLNKQTVPTRETDWWNYGGITRDVTLLNVPSEYVHSFRIELTDLETKNIKGWVQLAGVSNNTDVTVSIPELDFNHEIKTDDSGYAAFDFNANVELWSPQSPKLYDVKIHTGDDAITDRIGFRTLSSENDKILLNGKSIFLQGISMHEESILHEGKSFGKKDARAMINLAKELGVNFLRLAHYPHDAAMVRAADEAGIMTWSEIPVYWAMDWQNQETLDTAERHMMELMMRDQNRASTIIWSIANETPDTSERLDFLTDLAQTVREFDDSRLLSAALISDSGDFANVMIHLVRRLLASNSISETTKAAVRKEIGPFKLFLLNNSEKLGNWDPYKDISFDLDDPLGEVVDILSINQYFGWYYSAFLPRLYPFDEKDVRLEMLKLMDELVISAVQDKPMIISEMGAGAKYGLHAEELTIWSEEYQSMVYKTQFSMLKRAKNLVGISPWVLRDFRSSMRPLGGIQNYYNRKGLVSEKGEKKQAFYVLQEAYKSRELADHHLNH
jgi:beta-glucuronidase